jgi:hypothetical protein
MKTRKVCAERHGELPGKESKKGGGMATERRNKLDDYLDRLTAQEVADVRNLLRESNRRAVVVQALEDPTAEEWEKIERSAYGDAPAPSAMRRAVRAFLQCRRERLGVEHEPH